MRNEKTSTGKWYVWKFVCLNRNVENMFSLRFAWKLITIPLVYWYCLFLHLKENFKQFFEYLSSMFWITLYPNGTTKNSCNASMRILNSVYVFNGIFQRWKTVAIAMRSSTSIYRAIVWIRCHMLESTSYVSVFTRKKQWLLLLLLLAVKGKCTQKWATHMRSITNVCIALFQFCLLISSSKPDCWWNLMWPETVFENASVKIDHLFLPLPVFVHGPHSKVYSPLIL